MNLGGGKAGPIFTSSHDGTALRKVTTQEDSFAANLGHALGVQRCSTSLRAVVQVPAPAVAAERGMAAGKTGHVLHIDGVEADLAVDRRLVGTRQRRALENTRGQEIPAS